MRNRNTLAALVLLVAAVAAAGGALWQGRKISKTSQDGYTRAVAASDILETTRRSLNALNDAALSQYDFVIRNQPESSKAFLEALQTWNDESGTLALIGRRDRAAADIRIFSDRGNAAIREFQAAMALAQAGQGTAAIGRLRNSSATSLLREATEKAYKIYDEDQKRSLYDQQGLVRLTLLAIRRLGAVAAFLFVDAIVALVATLVILRRSQNGNALSRADTRTAA